MAGNQAYTTYVENVSVHCRTKVANVKEHSAYTEEIDPIFCQLIAGYLVHSSTEEAFLFFQQLNKPYNRASSVIAHK